MYLLEDAAVRCDVGSRSLLCFPCRMADRMERHSRLDYSDVADTPPFLYCLCFDSLILVIDYNDLTDVLRDVLDGLGEMED